MTIQQIQYFLMAAAKNEFYRDCKSNVCFTAGSQQADFTAGGRNWSGAFFRRNKSTLQLTGAGGTSGSDFSQKPFRSTERLETKFKNRCA